MSGDLVLDHLWQSTLVAMGIFVVALACRRAQAQTRYWIWFAASLKFLIPFAALSSLGAQLEWRETLPATPYEWTAAIDAVSQPFSAPEVNISFPRSSEKAALPLATLAGTVWTLGFVTILAVWLLRWRRVAAAVGVGTPITSGRVHDVFHRLAPSSALTLVSSDTSLEPGVFGILRPVILWPRDIDTRLDDAQVQAILAHELVHVHRRDNLTAAVHMLVEAVFWFHPLVWWIGTRLIDERERACDEEVVRRGSEPHVYAESVLRTCQFYVESPLSCVPGVTGSDLKKRIERIMTDRPGRDLGRWGKMLLVGAASITCATPVATGAMSASARPVLRSATPISNRPMFDVATITSNDSGTNRVTMRIVPGGAWEASNVTLESMIRLAYRLQEQQLAGGPSWIHNERFDILAKSAEGAPPSEFPQRMQSLLAERFNLKLHNETRDLPVYVLVPARVGSRGPRLSPASVDCTAAFSRGANPSGRERPAPLLPQGPGERPTCGIFTGPGRVAGGGVTMPQMATTFSQYTGRIVLDRTGLTGSFDYEVEFAPDQRLRGRGPGGGLPAGPAAENFPPSPNSVSIFTAVQEQLGLRLDPQRAPVDVLVIDSADQPKED